MRSTFYLTANGPGEISAFLVPMVGALRKQFGDARIVVILLPCTFASGREEEIARSIAGVDDVLPVRRLWPLILRGLPHPPTALIHLGGDLMYAGLLARRWAIPTWAFQWANRRWDRWMRGYFVRAEVDRARLLRQGIADERIHVIGDTMVDAVRTTLAAAGVSVPPPVDQVPATPHIAFLPGSRDIEVLNLTPFYLEVAEHLRAVWPQARFSLLLSPHVRWACVRQIERRPIDRRVGGLRGTLVRDNGGWSLVSMAGTRMSLVSKEPLLTLAASHFVVSIPGTKTGEAGSLGKPMLVVIPGNRMDQIPWHGLLGLLDWLPFIGRLIKRLIISTMVPRYIGRVYGQPNLLSAEPVVPELAHMLTPRLVADKILEIFGRPPVRGALPLRGKIQGPLGLYSNNGAVESDWLKMHRDLRALYAPHTGAAERAIAVISAALGHDDAVPEPVSR